MIYTEWVEGKASLFSSISSIMSGDIFLDLDVTNLDLLYKMNHGAKTIPTSIVNLSIDEVARIAVLTYKTKWEKEWQYLKNELNLGKLKEIIVEDSQKDDTIRVSTNDNVNSVSAFNDDEVSVNDSNEANTSDDIKHTYERTSTTTEKDFNIVKQQLEMLETSFAKKMCEDVSKMLSLSIY